MPGFASLWEPWRRRRKERERPREGLGGGFSRDPSRCCLHAGCPPAWGPIPASMWARLLNPPDPRMAPGFPLKSSSAALQGPSTPGWEDWGRADGDAQHWPPLSLSSLFLQSGCVCLSLSLSVCPSVSLTHAHIGRTPFTVTNTSCLRSPPTFMTSGMGDAGRIMIFFF